MMAASSNRTTQNECLTEPGYFTLRTLAAYSNCSVRWLRDRLMDRAHPLPHYRIGGKLLVKRDEFDQWMNVHHVVHPSDQLSQIVESVMTQFHPPQRVA
jgi:excisionase family DNA binding protein